MKKRLGLYNSVYSGGMDGLGVSKGRLINSRHECESGISKMAKARAMEKREKKVSMIADGVMRAEMMEMAIESGGMIPIMLRKK